MIKIDLITGFLGSGKTTFLKKYAAWLVSRGEKIGILENDLGPVNVDMMLLKSLEGEGLIRLESAPGDRRSKEVHLTEAGTARAAASVDRVLEIEEQAALRLSPEERLAILALERRHLEALRQEAERLLSEHKED